jgi:E3 ubiquitin-protein ligase synoviolin
MDHLTREAIDERLRVLERVSNTLYGCVDDLLRMRSSLPEIAPAVSGVTTHTGGDSFQGTSTSSLSTRAAEKRPETARSNPEEVARNGSHDG